MGSHGWTIKSSLQPMHSYWKFDTMVRRGYVYYMPDEKVVKVDVTQRIKNYTKKVIN